MVTLDFSKCKTKGDVNKVFINKKKELEALEHIEKEIKQIT